MAIGQRLDPDQRLAQLSRRRGLLVAMISFVMEACKSVLLRMLGQGLLSCEPILADGI
jgi:hypothetical protein